jgi:hypothetical protein
MHTSNAYPRKRGGTKRNKSKKEITNERKEKK